jgi:hypothetical protein
MCFRVMDILGAKLLNAPLQGAIIFNPPGVLRQREIPDKLIAKAAERSHFK